MGGKNSSCCSVPKNVEVPPNYQPKTADASEEEVALQVHGIFGGGRRKRPTAMSAAAMRLLLARPKVPAPLDPNFVPLVLAKRSYLTAVEAAAGEVLEWALTRPGGCARGVLPVFREDHADMDASAHLAGVLIQQMVWQRSASALLLCGPAKVCDELMKAYCVGGRYTFEVMKMPQICGSPDKPFEVTRVSSAGELPPETDSPVAFGQVAIGSRLALELTKGMIKAVAVKENEVLETKELEWDSASPDPKYHTDRLSAAVKQAAASLEKVEAIGGSTSGIVLQGCEATWSDELFRKVPAEAYQEHIVPIFQNLAKELGDVPVKVINEGDLSAIAGSLMVRDGNVLAISMGSTMAAGYCKENELLGWVNGLPYTQLDLNPMAPADPWAPGHAGLSHLYLGQRGATKLAALAGLDVPPDMRPDHSNMNSTNDEPHNELLRIIQAAMKDPDQEPNAGVRLLYETVGVYLGYALAQYAEHYTIDHILLQGPVSTGAGGMVMCDKAKEVLAKEFPEMSHIRFHFPDEHFQTVGRSIAAAALPPPHVGIHASA